MKTFNLPDLGEGLAEAEIREWYVAEGDEVKVEQPLLAMETAKAVVDVPSPFSGRIQKLYGKAGDIIQTGHPLVSFEGESDAGTVVGALQVGNEILEEAPEGIAVATATTAKIKASPAVRALAKQSQVDLATVKATGPGGAITLDDVKRTAAASPAAGETLHGVRRVMAQTMAAAHHEVVPITVVEDADIQHWPANTDITVRLIRAIAAACATEPALNAHFHGQSLSRQLFKEINLGLALDTPAGLYVPVLKNVTQRNDAELRQQIDAYKTQAREQNFSPEDLHGTTITLSNFGTFTGRYASPIVVPPTVAILAVGRLRDEVIATQEGVAVHKIMPLSLTVDHRAVTGGEAARFLAALIKQLQE
ncbi:MAG: dihydrolipoamide acetyltransferase family protein [Gammaproteobacteria bacterium]